MYVLGTLGGDWRCQGAGIKCPLITARPANERLKMGAQGAGVKDRHCMVFGMAILDREKVGIYHKIRLHTGVVHANFLHF